jgi:hypothetical protein
MDTLENKVIAATTPEAAQAAISEAQAQQAQTAAAQFLASGMKPGWQSTEFWLAILANVGTVAGAFSGLIPPPWGAVAAAAGAVVTSVVYTVSRGSVKAQNIPAMADLAKAIQDAKSYGKKG